MKNTFGSTLGITLAGESHGPELTVIIDGLAPGIAIDEKYIASALDKRRPSGTISTARVEADEFRITSGVFNGYSTGAPICIVIPNGDIRSGDYSKAKDLPRPSHADYTASVKYEGYQDYRGGGHFSGRITAALVAAGAVCSLALREGGIALATHIKQIANEYDREFLDLEKDIEFLSQISFPVLAPDSRGKMWDSIEKAKEQGDSVGGVLETAVIGLPAGVGEPWFDTLEGTLAHILFSIPAVKGVEFGLGFGFATKKGSCANDPFFMSNGSVRTASNNNGGINGGISNGMPIIFRTAVKPTPSIAAEQYTVSLSKKENAKISIAGRHDPCIVHRAACVVNACTSIALLDSLYTRYGRVRLGNI